jgi:predicted transcriptional regulator
MRHPAPREERPFRLISFRVDAELGEEIERAAAQQDRSLSAVCRQAVRNFIRGRSASTSGTTARHGGGLQ